METSASSGRKKRLLHIIYIATIDAIEHVLNDANSYLAYWPEVVLHYVYLDALQSIVLKNYTEME
jgi:hypothetical protein